VTTSLNDAGTLMSYEMAEQPAVLTRLAARAATDMSAVRELVPDPPVGIVFVARGSSDNAAVFGRYLAELHTGRPAGLASPSLYTRYRAQVNWGGYLVIALSQSGATPEIVSTCAQAQAAGATVIGITNEPGSPLEEVSNLLLSTDAGPERAIPATKTMTAQMLLVATVVAAIAGQETGPETAELPAAVRSVLRDQHPVDELAERWRDIDRLIVTGRGLAYAAALEIALKIKETTGILAEGISTADLRHGPIATAFAGSPVLLINAGGPAAADIKELGSMLNVRGGQAALLPLSTSLPEPAQVIASVVRGQQLARALALANGIDPDSPQGLTKVTPTT